MIPLLKILAQRSKWFFAWLILFGAMNSAAYSVLLYIINSYVTQRPQLHLLSAASAGYLAVVAVALVSGQVFQAYMIRLTNELLTEFELDILQKLRSASFETFDKLGNERAYTAIADARTLSTVPAHFIGAFNAVIIIVCSLGYIMYISPVGGASILLVMALLMAYYLHKNNKVEKDLNELRTMQNSYFRYLADLMYGFKELKMSIAANENLFHHYLRRNRMAAKSLSIKTSVSYARNELVGGFSWYFVIFVILFGLAGVLDTPQRVGLVVIILYIIGPVGAVITFLPFYTNAKIALERIEQFGRDIDQQLVPELPAEEALPAGFDSLVFEQVTYQYTDKNGNPQFTFGPLDLEIRRGERIFLTGGNGSGKSTFINLLVGLCKPTTGTIYLNGRRLPDDQYPGYRNRISVIFTNHYLFEENYEAFDLSAANRKLTAYIELLKMEEIIRLEHGERVLSKDLSKGQQKRLGLIRSLLEGRHLLVLDEWAAEQDPEFRKYFYEELMQELTLMGKTLIAATHDDRYFGCADRVLKFERGKLVADLVPDLVPDPFAKLEPEATRGE